MVHATVVHSRISARICGRRSAVAPSLRRRARRAANAAREDEPESSHAGDEGDDKTIPNRTRHPRGQRRGEHHDHGHQRHADAFDGFFERFERDRGGPSGSGPSEQGHSDAQTSLAHDEIVGGIAGKEDTHQAQR